MPEPTPTLATGSIDYTAYAKSMGAPAKVGPTGKETLPVSGPLVYTWDYHSERPELRALYEKSKDLNWNARTDLPWETPIEPESEITPDAMNPLFGTKMWRTLERDGRLGELRRNFTAYMLSNFMHGEQGALLGTAQLVDMAPTLDAKMYAAAQVFDEARHVEAYDRYLREKIELVYPISPYLKQLLDALLQDSRADFKFLGMQIMVEGVALAAFGLIQQLSTEGLIKQLTQMIMQDESRHVAFGVLALKDSYVGMAAGELRDREDFIIESSTLLRDRFLAQEVWERMGLPEDACKEAVEGSEAMAIFRRLLFSKIVPNTKRLGLLTPYVRKGFEQLGVIGFEHLPPTA